MDQSELINQIAALIYNYNDKITTDEYNELFDLVWDTYQDIKYE